MEVLETNELKDFDYLHNLHFRDEFNLPSTKNTSTVRTVKDGNKVVASGIVKLCVEAIIVTDQDLPAKTRVEAIDMLMENMLEWCRTNGIEQVQVYVKKQFAEVLIRRYGFKTLEDITLVLQVENAKTV